MTTYIVIATPKYPTWDEVNGVEFYIEDASSKSDAIKQAKRKANDNDVFDRFSGRVTWKASEDQY